MYAVYMYIKDTIILYTIEMIECIYILKKEITSSAMDSKN